MAFDESKMIKYKLRLPNATSQSLKLYDVDSGTSDFDIRVDQGFDTWQIVSTNAKSGKEAFFIAATKEENDHSLITPSFNAKGKKPVFKFSHRFETQKVFDGGFVSISTNNGTTWESLNDKYLTTGHTQDIDSSTFAIPELKGFSGSTGGKYIDTYIDLSSYEGKDVKFRFRYGSDTTGTESNGGWWIDDFELIDANTSTTFACIDDEKKDKKECTTNRLLIYASDNTTDIKLGSEEFNSLNIFPNPARERLYLSYETQQSGVVKCSIYNLDGKNLLSTSPSLSQGQNIIALDISSLASGLYFLECMGNEGRLIKKFIKTN
jgi:hypothetical protein